MFSTYVKPSSDLRNRYQEITALVNENNQVIITNNGRAEIVLVKIEDYAKYEEFLHWRYVDEKLSEAEKRADEPDALWLTHEEFWAKAREL